MQVRFSSTIPSVPHVIAVPVAGGSIAVEKISDAVGMPASIIARAVAAARFEGEAIIAQQREVHHALGTESAERFFLRRGLLQLRFAADGQILQALDDADTLHEWPLAGKGEQRRFRLPIDKAAGARRASLAGHKG